VPHVKPVIEPPRRDPVTEVFEAAVRARHDAPGGEDGWTVAVRSRTGQLMARFTLGSRAQVLAFARKVRLLGYRMTRREREGGRDFDFCLDRRAANQALRHPLRRRDDRVPGRGLADPPRRTPPTATGRAGPNNGGTRRRTGRVHPREQP